MPKFIDIGANLNDDMFRGLYRGKQRHDADLDHVLKRGKEVGVGAVLITVGSESDIKPTFKIMEDFGSQMHMRCTIGIHPTRGNELKNNPDLLNHIRDTYRKNADKIIAYGEFGLDYDRLHFCDKEQQKISFEAQLQLVGELDLPMFLHNRVSTDDFCEILERNRAMWEKRGGVVHSFTGTVEEAKQLLALGDNIYISINGCGLKEPSNLDALAAIPVSRLILETDCPWCKIRNTHASKPYLKTPLAKEVDPEKFSRDLVGVQVKGRCELDHMLQVAEVAFAVQKERGALPADVQTFEEFCDVVYQNTLSVYPQLAFE